MQMRPRIIAAAGVLAALALAAPAAAHEGHASCSEGTHTFIVTQAQTGTLGQQASEQARAGTLNENLAAAHAALCEPKP